MDEKVFCAGCIRGNERNKGEHWCNDCEEPVCHTCAKFHKKLNPPHTTVPLHTENQKKEDIHNLPSINKFVFCETHSERKITLFCPKHYEFLCDLCLLYQHHDCKGLMTSEKAFTDKRIVSAYNDLERRMENHLKETRDTCEKHDKLYLNKQKHIETKKGEILKRISEIKTKLISKLNRMEQVVTTELDIKSNKCITFYHEKKSEVDSKLSTIKEWINDLEYVRKFPSNINLSLVIEYYEEEIDYMKAGLQSIYFPDITFKHSSQIEKLERSFSFGETIESHCDDQVCDLGNVFKEHDSLPENLPLIGLLSTTHLGDNVEIGSLCFIHDNKILFADLYKTNELFLCMYDKSCSKQITLTRETRQLASYDKNFAVATTTDGLQIINLSVLKAGELILPGTECGSVGCIDKQIFVGVDQRTITVIDISGNILKTITTSFSLQDISINSHGDIYCLTDDCHDIYMVSNDGEERFVLSTTYLGGVCDMAAVDEGLYIISSMKSNDINIVSKTGERQGVAVSNCGGIYGIEYNRETHQISCVDYDAKSVKIYQL